MWLTSCLRQLSFLDVLLLFSCGSGGDKRFGKKLWKRFPSHFCCLKDLDPKFRILLFLLVIQVMLAGATINVYVWNVHTVPPTPAEACIYNDPYMQKPIFAAAFGGMCVSDCSVTYGPNYGHDWTKTGAPCRQFIITNNTVVQDRATGHAEAQKRVLDEVKKREIVDAEGKKKVWNPFLKKYVEVAQK